MNIAAGTTGAIENSCEAIGSVMCGNVIDTMLLIINSAPVPNFTMVPDSTNANNFWAFNAAVAGGLNYAWSFPGGSPATSTTASPTVVYTTPGTYTVCLDITSGTCTNTTCHTLTVSGALNTCNALYNIAHDTASSNPNSYTVTDLSFGSNLTYLWDFGDTTTSPAQHPVHTYLGSGPYQLCLTVDNGAGCTSTYCDSLFAVDSLHAHLQPIAFNVVDGPAFGTTVGVNNESAMENGEWIISPNPTTGIVKISSSKFQVSSVRVMNVLGEVVFQSTINSRQSTIDLSAAAKGVYFIQINTGAGIINKRLIKE